MPSKGLGYWFDHQEVVKTNALVHMLLKPLIYYDKVYLYAKIIDQEKYQLLSNELNKLATKIYFLLIKYMNILTIK